MNKFIARYTDDKGISKSVVFDSNIFDKEKAIKYLNNGGVKNFFFFFEPYEPVKFGDNAYLFRGDIGFDITTEKLIPYIQAGNEIILDSFGGDLWEGLKIFDAIQAMDNKPTVGVLGSCASAAILPLLAVPIENRWMSANSRFLTHNPWTCACGDDEELKKVANNLEKEKIKLANLQANITGQDVESILQLMKEERFLNFEEAKKYNFVNKSNNKFNKKDDDMNNEEVNEKLSGLETMMNGIKAAISKLVPSPKNIIIQDTNGVELDFPDAETEEQIVVGMTVKVNGEDGQSGDYVMGDGRTFVVVDGVLTEIKEVAGDDEEMEALKKENEELKQQLEDVQNSVKNVEKERDDLKASLNDVSTQVETVKNELNDCKNKFSGEEPKPNTPESESGEGKKVSYNKSKLKNQ